MYFIRIDILKFIVLDIVFSRNTFKNGVVHVYKEFCFFIRNNEEMGGYTLNLVVLTSFDDDPLTGGRLKTQLLSLT